MNISTNQISNDSFKNNSKSVFQICIRINYPGLKRQRLTKMRAKIWTKPVAIITIVTHKCERKLVISKINVKNKIGHILHSHTLKKKDRFFERARSAVDSWNASLSSPFPTLAAIPFHIQISRH